jgi:hypothetical protein
MTASETVIKFLRIYFIFIAFVLVINLSMELLISPENHKIIAEYGWMYFLQNQLISIILFFSLFSLVGTIIFLKTKYNTKKMGSLSLIAGFILEFALIKPDWVQNIYAFRIWGEVIGAILVSSFYWFVAWGIPSYIFNKRITPEG